SMARKVAMLLNAPYPADIRVKKETDALINAGFEIFLICLRKKNQAPREVVEGINVIRIDAGKNNYVLAFWDVVMSITFIHPRFKKALNNLLLEEKISIVHVHDLPLAGTALALRRQFSIKVIVDLHENYPEALRTWFKWKKNLIVRLKNKLFLNPDRWFKYETKACLEADHVIAVVDEMKSRLAKSSGVDLEKITVITNTEDKNFIEQKLNKDVYENIPNGFIITYSGGIGPHRGVDTAIKGMAHLRDKPIYLVIVGFGSPSVMTSLKELATQLQLQNVYFKGYQPFEKFYSYMHLADVNVIPHQSNGHTDNTVPHKLFQGMMAGRPLLVSTCAPLKRIVEEYKSGLVFKADDATDFAAKVETLYSDKQLCEKLGANGTTATINGKLNWETTQVELVKLYERFT
ncbi:MAG TPA: glycosyltransferase family 4 protein, partial [Cyclobacteriaceae bacterium]|nr:glycosyltransferase family 4 protein [Cyclobacteriaceae bacterium]